MLWYPSYHVIKSLKVIWKSGTRRWNQWDVLLGYKDNSSINGRQGDISSVFGYWWSRRKSWVSRSNHGIWKLTAWGPNTPEALNQFWHIGTAAEANTWHAYVWWPWVPMRTPRWHWHRQASALGLGKPNANLLWRKSFVSNGCEPSTSGELCDVGTEDHVISVIGSVRQANWGSVVHQELGMRIRQL